MLSIKKTISEFSTTTMLTAYDALISYNVHQLPVEPHSILSNLNNVSIYSYEEFSQIMSRSIKHLRSMFGPGVMLYSDRKEKHCIIYDSELSEHDFRWFLSNCIAAARLQLDDFSFSTGSYFDSFDDSNLVVEFTYYFTAPDPVLKECKIFSTEDIAKYCKIPFKLAHKKHKHLCNRRKYKIIYPAEAAVVNCFNEFIKIFR